MIRFRSLLEEIRIVEEVYPLEKTRESIETESGSLEYLYVVYDFSTDQNDYQISFESLGNPRDIDISYKTKSGSYKTMTGEGNAYSIFNTVIESVKTFVSEYKNYINRLVISPSSKGSGFSSSENQRGRVYYVFLRRNFPSWEVEKDDRNIYVRPN